MDVVKLDKQSKERLSVLKRRTGIAHNNVLCRWALCRSLAEPTAPMRTDGDEVALEIRWETFAGELAPVLEALMRERLLTDGIAPDETALDAALRLHVHRGIGYLFGTRELSDIEALVRLALDEPAR